MELNVRDATDRDIDALYTTDIQCFDTDLVWERGSWLSRLHNCTVSVVTSKQDVLGFCCTKGEDDEALIQKVAIRPPFRGHGAGLKVLIPAAQWALYMGHDARLVIPETHLPFAANWAIRVGFRSDPKHPIKFGYFKGGIDGINMHYDLQRTQV
ncbi:MAG: GNAT family N-acetyltransferase [Planctomycetota bacterium]|jgi:N-acetylglutamate synthase-like GNAT family acetyltransferase